MCHGPWRDLPVETVQVHASLEETNLTAVGFQFLIAFTQLEKQCPFSMAADKSETRTQLQSGHWHIGLIYCCTGSIARRQYRNAAELYDGVIRLIERYDLTID